MARGEGRRVSNVARDFLERVLGEDAPVLED